MRALGGALAAQEGPEVPSPTRGRDPPGRKRERRPEANRTALLENTVGNGNAVQSRGVPPTTKERPKMPLRRPEDDTTVARRRRMRLISTPILQWRDRDLSDDVVALLLSMHPHALDESDAS